MSWTKVLNPDTYNFMKKSNLILLVLCLASISCVKDNSAPSSKTVTIDYEFTTSLAASYAVEYYDPNVGKEITETFYGTSWSKKFTATVNNSTGVDFTIQDYSSPMPFQSNCSAQILIDGQIKQTNTAIVTTDSQDFETLYTITF